MRFSFTDEQEEFRRSVRRFLQDRSPISEVRRLMETESGYHAGVWKELCQGLCLTGVHVPETYGGQGFGFVELAIALEEMGRVLLCAPYFASAVLATGAILNAADEAQKRRLLAPILAGDAIATLAVAEPAGRWDAEASELVATRDGSAFLLNGVKSFVLDGLRADAIVVAGRAPGSSGAEGLSLFVVAGDAAGLERRPLSSLDATRKLARLELSAVRAEVLGEPGAAAAALARTLDEAAVALANEMVGGAQRVLETTVEYAKTRMQFGRPIGSFQAVKHKCADLLLDVEHAKSAAYAAASALAERHGDAPAFASLAKACASDAYLRAASDSIQIHGGVGFTWENDCHLYFKRAKCSEAFFGLPHEHRERFLRRSGI